LEARVEKKLRANKVTGTLNRIHVAMPQPRDDKERLPVAAPPKEEKMVDAVSETPLEKMQRLFEERMKMEQDERDMWARGEVPGMKSKLWQERYLLKNPEWRFDKIPELLDGKNIADFVDADIEQMLEELEREEEERVAKLDEEKANLTEESELDEEEVQLLKAIRRKKKLMRSEHSTEKTSRPTTRNMKTREQTFDDLKAHLKSRGFDEEQAKEAVGNVQEHARSRSRSASRMGRKRDREEDQEFEKEGTTELQRKKQKRESKSRSRLLSLTPKAGSGMKDLKDVLVAKKIQKNSIKNRSREGRRGESDKDIPSKMPKHLFSGKRGIGKTDRR